MQERIRFLAFLGRLVGLSFLGWGCGFVRTVMVSPLVVVVPKIPPLHESTLTAARTRLNCRGNLVPLQHNGTSYLVDFLPS
jgi:hypothetical protein